MPFYQFRCVNDKCDLHEQPMEVLLNLQEYEATKNNQRCPLCGSKMKRAFNGGRVGIKFNAKGFYSTDYKGKNTV